jgi:hypothetical protein
MTRCLVVVVVVRRRDGMCKGVCVGWQKGSDRCEAEWTFERLNTFEARIG